MKILTAFPSCFFFCCIHGPGRVEYVVIAYQVVERDGKLKAAQLYGIRGVHRSGEYKVQCRQ